PPPPPGPFCPPLPPPWAPSGARPATRYASMPKEPSPASTSPLNFRRMRPYFATELLSRGSIDRRIADLEPHEARNGNVFAELGDFRLDHFGDGRCIFLDERLLVQADLFKVLV